MTSHLRDSILIGVDPGLRTAGLAGIRYSREDPERSQLLVLESFTDQTSDDWKTVLERELRWIRSTLLQYYRPVERKVIAIEDFVFTGKRRKAGFAVSKIVGGLYADLRRNGLHLVTVFGPGEWRKALTGAFTDAQAPCWLASLDVILRKQKTPDSEHCNDAYQMALLLAWKMYKGEINVL
jgi:Holliday junction resolvasome RuvABC endonuclease subunit